MSHEKREHYRIAFQAIAQFIECYFAFPAT